MSDTGLMDRQRMQRSIADQPFEDGRLATLLGLVGILMGFAAAAAGTWIAYGQAGSLVPLPGGLPAAESQVVSIYLVACGAMTAFLGGISIYRAQRS